MVPSKLANARPIEKFSWSLEPLHDLLTDRSIWAEGPPLTFVDMKTGTTKLSKSVLRRTLKDLPDPFVVEDLIQRILLLQAVERGLEDVEAGRTVSQEEAKAMLAQRWRK